MSTENELVDMLSTLTTGFEHLTARLIRLEATVSVHVAVHAALVRSHPEPEFLREAWLQLSSLLLARTSMHDGEKDGLRRVASVSGDTIRHITEMIDEVVDLSRQAGC